MLYVEKNFPRGGTTVRATPALKNKENISFGPVVEKPKKKNKNKKQDAILESQQQREIDNLSAQLLNYDSIQDGMVIMGVVKSVASLYLNISLPGGITARVTAIDISDSYTKVTRQFLEQSQGSEHYKPLTQLYKIGQVVYVRVMEIKEVTNKKIIRFSLKPADVHVDLLHTNVSKGFIFNGAIAEVQEHGYIIETGINGLRAFVSTEKTIKQHTLGEIIYLKVEKISHDQTVSTSICKELKLDALNLSEKMEMRLDYILPTSIVKFTVSKHMKDGLKGTIVNKSFNAYINEHHLSTPLSTPDDYELNSTLRARVLYVMPLSKTVFLTLNQYTEIDIEPVYKRGDIVENAQVIRLTPSGIILLLDEKHKGIISYKSIKANYKGNYDQDEILQRYAKSSVHKLRILQYGLMDNLYVCTDDPAILREKFFSLDNIEPGAFVTATVVKSNLVGGYELRLGKLHARIEALFLMSSSKGLKTGAKLRCRVLYTNAERSIIYLTNRSEYMNKQGAVLTNWKQAKPNAVFMGTVVKNEDNIVLVRFFNGIKGLLLKHEIQSDNEVPNFYVGQTTQFRIVSRDDEQIILGLPQYIFKMGDIRAATVINKLDEGLEVEVETLELEENDKSVEDDEKEEDTKKKNTINHIRTKGLIPLCYLSDFNDLLLAKLHMYAANTELETVCINKNILSLRDVSYFREEQSASMWRNLRIGDIVKAVVKSVEDEVVELMLLVRDYNKLVRIHWQMLLMGVNKNNNIVLSSDQVIYCRVLGKNTFTKTITVSAKLTDVWSGQLNDTANYVERYLDEVSEIRKTFKMQSKPLAKYVRGGKVNAHFQSVDAKSGDWLFELEETFATAIVRSYMVNKMKPLEVGHKQECIVLWIDYSREIVYISNNLTDSRHISKARKLPDNLLGISGIAAKVLLKLDTVFICSLKKANNPLVYCPISLHYNDFERTASNEVKEGQYIRLAFVHQTLPIAVLESSYKLWKQVKLKRKMEENLIALSKKAKVIKPEKRKGNIETKIEKIELENEKEIEMVKEPVQLENIASSKKPRLEDREENLFYEDKTPNRSELYKIVSDVQSETVSREPAIDVCSSKLPGVENFWSTNLTQSNNEVSSEDDADDHEDGTQQRKRKLTASEKFKRLQAEDARLRAIEEKYANPKQIPESVDQFDRLVLSEPNNSKHWINYMVYNLQAAEIDKARAVARRALKTISFREADELLNIWIALLNLELRYGSLDSYKNTLQEALTCNEPRHVYLRVLQLLSAEDCNKKSELLEIIETTTRKFKTHAEIWHAAANAYFSVDMPESAQQLLQKALICLPKRDHINTIVSFANLNYKFNHKEFAHTLLDQVVTSYPKRVDIWAQYVDMLLKDKLIDSARTVLERAVTNKIPLKKMRTLFKKYLEFEQRFGTEKDVENVKELAMEYVKNNSML